MSKIEEIASVHLGKAGDGSVVKPYVTPDSVDPSLLVGIPRHLNRTQYNIDDQALPFVGSDTWNCYEFSTLANNGFPISGVVRIVYSSDSPNIVESKSLKLYLNSFNMQKCGDSAWEVIDYVEGQITEDLVKALGTEEVFVAFLDTGDRVKPPMANIFNTIEDHVDTFDLKFDQYNEDPNTLVVTVSSESEWKFHHSAALRSNCRVTNQPDWGDVYIVISGHKQVTEESLLQYIVSMRKENHFHEEICECIYKRLLDLLEPKELLVACLYTRRGGIDINPVRASNEAIIHTYARNLTNAYILNEKTLRQ
jgi:7-cyano-7-deazaguanine reductase